MKPITPWTAVLAVCGVAVCGGGQTPLVQPQIAGRPVQEGQVTTVYLAPRFATAIRMPDGINSVVLGDPESFSAEHSDREPQIVFVKPITTKPAETNLLISTTRGYAANMLLISRGEAPGAQQGVDFLLRYRPAGRFIIEPTIPSASVAETKPLEGAKSAPSDDKPLSARQRSADSGAGLIRPVSLSIKEDKGTAPASDAPGDLERLLERQRRAPLPVLYGERPGVASPGKEILKAGVSEVIDQGKQVVVLFAAVNMQDHAVELMPPQVQLAGKVKKGAIIRHKVWSNSEQLPVEEFRLSRRRLGPGERADGVLVFERPRFKQSNETLLLQIADSGAVDRPALAPIGFGISSLRQEGGE
jgi:hypothetical protein